MKAVFLRPREETEDKAQVLREAVVLPDQALGQTRFAVEPTTFGQVPRSPFAYWVSDRVRGLYAELPALETDGRTAKQGLATADDFRFVRLWTEVGVRERLPRWFPFAKGGKFSPFYSDVHLVVDWGCDGAAIRNSVDLKSGRQLSRPQNTDFFFRSGLTWPRRTTSGLSLRVMPTGCIFGDKGPAAFVDGDDAQQLLFFLSVSTSRAFQALVELQLAAADAAARSYEVGVMQRTPVPVAPRETSSELGKLAHAAWSLKRALDTRKEHSHVFCLPALLQIGGESLRTRLEEWSARVAQVEPELVAIQNQIDDLCFELYGIDGAERQQIERGFGGGHDDVEGEPSGIEDAESVGLDETSLTASLISWTLGVSFGRFDLRLATGERSVPPESGPFDPLPVCSPGMLIGNDGLSVDTPPRGYPILFPADGILVDDPGAASDMVTACRQVFAHVFDDPNTRWEEAAEILGDRDTGLRTWFSTQFFENHIKLYSQSRRKAPIYWQLATPSASYSAWIYYHRFNRDTLFRLLNDHVMPKLQHEERKLTNLTQEAGPDPSSSQRKEISSQEIFVGELRSFRDEVARVAPLWNPNLNDGVILNFAPLWRLVPQHKGWQKECKAVWDKLCKGEFDWAHLAMHLWPERVVPKCAKDLSLAIAHELEDVFWQEDAGGKWLPKIVSEDGIAVIVAERTSAAVKGALKDLLEAPMPARGRGKAPRRKPANSRRSRGSVSSRKTNEGSQPQLPLVDPTVRERVYSAIAQLGGNGAKAEILEVAGLSSSQWNSTINALLADGSVTKTGQKRGTRYHLAGGSS